MEMFEAFGFAERVRREAYWVNETTFWKPDDKDRGKIVRSSRIQDTEDGLSEFPHVILNQARVHDFYLDTMRNAPTRLAPHYSRRLVDLEVSAPSADGVSDYPVTARLERLDAGHEGRTETVRARYVVGCDGARSAVRTSLGRALHGDSANQAWGVMDVLAITDSPDVRFKSAIQSASEGNALIIPREGGYLFRIYIELDKLSVDERVSRLKITSGHLVAAAQRILRPYTLDVKEIAWWSVYEIGQRLCDKFDNLAEDAPQQAFPRVFIAGDACHTHSPKAGQGMNVSMQDAFNLGGKLAAVLMGRARPQILRTYSSERQAVAQELIDFDRKWSRMFSAPPKDASRSDSEGVDPAEFQTYFMQQARFTAGTATCYRPSILTGKPTWGASPKGSRSACGFIPRRSFASLTRGRFNWGMSSRRTVASGCGLSPTRRTPRARRRGSERCAIFSPVPRIRRCESTRRPAPTSNSVIDVRAIFQKAHRDLKLDSMPAFLMPRKGRYGLTDYEKMFCPDLKSGADIFDLRGVDRRHGCVVVVRPDQYVAHVLPLDEYAELESFFDGFMAPCGSE